MIKNYSHCKTIVSREEHSHSVFLYNKYLQMRGYKLTSDGYYEKEGVLHIPHFYKSVAELEVLNPYSYRKSYKEAISIADLELLVMGGVSYA